MSIDYVAENPAQWGLLDNKYIKLFLAGELPIDYFSWLISRAPYVSVMTRIII